eukprot:1025806-Prymnesium_polylepis.2
MAAPRGVFTLLMALIEPLWASQCAKGHYCSGGATYPCAAGTYNPAEGATSNSSCLQCPEHATSPVASSAYSQCLCEFANRGFISVADGANFVCRCPNGTDEQYKIGGGKECVQCPSGSYRALADGGACIACPRNLCWEPTSALGATLSSECACPAEDLSHEAVFAIVFGSVVFSFACCFLCLCFMRPDGVVVRKKRSRMSASVVPSCVGASVR